MMFRCFNDDEMQNSLVSLLEYRESLSFGRLLNSFTAKSISFAPSGPGPASFLCATRTTPNAPLPITSWHSPYFSTNKRLSASSGFILTLMAVVGCWMEFWGPENCVISPLFTWFSNPDNRVGGKSLLEAASILALASLSRAARLVEERMFGMAETAEFLNFLAPSQSFTIWPNFSCLLVLRN
ncbi:hypothetical protein OGAPHI_003624 [Ogataea philodendri]|uniref:Uncharacterized protein n=1 Tax=Ogataea philodendri TaxID=1378263 RepID=A0A9P8P5J2_9ASCO|nr:uncharacterized protein OGAPHI_003624 [Ogataea philodendri]KAH3665440.1 hypothetical protein OGAPHI_003624 [Ogataea philodendri]